MTSTRANSASDNPASIVHTDRARNRRIAYWPRARPRNSAWEVTAYKSGTCVSDADGGGRLTAVDSMLTTYVRRWFGVVSAGEDVQALVAPLLIYNRALTSPRQGWQDGEVTVLVVEQQGVWLWGRRADGVYVERENEDGLPWRALDEDESAFWLHHAAFEATTRLAANRSAQELGADAVQSIIALVDPLPCGTWTWPGTSQRIYARRDAVVMVCRDGEDYWVVAAAPEEADLDWLDALGLFWDEYDSRLGQDDHAG